MKKLIVLMAVLSAFGLAKAEENAYQYLYWQVQPENVADDVGDYNAAFLYALDGDNVRTPLGVIGWDTTQTARARTASEVVGTMDLTEYLTAGSSFLFELAYWDETDGTKPVGSSEVYGRDAIRSYLTSFAGGSSVPTQNVFAPTFSSSVPEPASGALLLFGLAGLALRRRRV